MNPNPYSFVSKPVKGSEKITFTGNLAVDLVKARNSEGFKWNIDEKSLSYNGY